MTTYQILLIVLGLVLQASFIKIEHDEKYVPAVILKGLASLMFVLLGASFYFGTAIQGMAIAKYIFIGLVFGMLGDILLNMRFVFKEKGDKVFLVGILAFLIGHIMYLVALIPYAVKPGLCVIIGALLAAALLTYIFRTMKVKTAFKIFGVVYLGAVIIMTVIAIGIALARASSSAIIYAIGAVTFTGSDIVLIFNTFGGGEPKFSMRICNLSMYYIGQLLIAISMNYIIR